MKLEVTGFPRSEHTENHCGNREEVGDKYTCTNGHLVNEQELFGCA